MIYIFFLQLVRPKRGDGKLTLQFVTTPNIYHSFVMDKILFSLYAPSVTSRNLSYTAKTKKFYDMSRLEYPTIEELDEYCKLISEYKTGYDDHIIFKLDFEYVDAWALKLIKFNSITIDTMKNPIDDLRILTRGCQLNLACEMCNKLTAIAKAVFSNYGMKTLSSRYKYEYEIEKIFISSH